MEHCSLCNTVSSAVILFASNNIRIHLCEQHRDKALAGIGVTISGDSIQFNEIEPLPHRDIPTIDIDMRRKKGET